MFIAARFHCKPREAFDGGRRPDNVAGIPIAGISGYRAAIVAVEVFSGPADITGLISFGAKSVPSSKFRPCSSGP